MALTCEFIIHQTRFLIQAHPSQQRPCPGLQENKGLKSTCSMEVTVKLIWVGTTEFSRGKRTLGQREQPAQRPGGKSVQVLRTRSSLILLVGKAVG